MREAIIKLFKEREYNVIDKEWHIDEFKNEHEAFYIDKKGFKQCYICSFIDLNKNLHSEMPKEPKFQEYILNILTVSPQEINGNLKTISTDKNTSNLIFIKADNINDYKLIETMLAIEKDPYISRKKVILYNDYQENFIKNITDNNMLNTIQSYIFSKDNYNDFSISDIESETFFKYDILSKLLMKLPILQTTKKDILQFKGMKIKHDFLDFQLNLNTDVIITSDEFNDVFKLLKGKNEVLNDNLKNYQIKFVFGNENQTEYLYEKNKPMKTIQHSDYNDENVLPLLYIYTGIVFGFGLIKNSNLFKPKQEFNYNHYATSEKRKTLAVLLDLATYHSNKNESIPLVLDLDGIQNDMTIVGISELITENDKLIITNLENEDLSRFLRYKMNGKGLNITKLSYSDVYYNVTI